MGLVLLMTVERWSERGGNVDVVERRKQPKVAFLHEIEEREGGAPRRVATCEPEKVDLVPFDQTVTRLTVTTMDLLDQVQFLWLLKWRDTLRLAAELVKR
jgi:hypothetical protein